jgi:hypothetical protein
VAAACIVLGMISVLLVTGLRYGFPMLNGAERFAYRKTIAGFFFLHIIYNALTVGLIMGYFSAFRIYRKISVPLYLVFLLLLALFGEKQTALSLNLIGFALVPALVQVARTSELPLAFIGRVGLIVTLVTVPTVLISYGVSENPASALNKFANRAVLQGQLWHLSDLQVLGSAMRFDMQTFLIAINDLLSLSFRSARDVGFDYGLYNVMARFSDYEVLTTYVQEGIGFIFALYPAWLAQYGWPVMLTLAAIGGIMWSLVMIAMMVILSRGSHLGIPVIAVLITMHIAAQIDGISYRIMGARVLIFLALALLLSFVPMMRPIGRCLRPERIKASTRGTVS